MQLVVWCVDRMNPLPEADIATSVGPYTGTGDGISSRPP